MNPTDILIRMIVRSTFALATVVLATACWVLLTLDDTGPVDSTWSATQYLSKFVMTLLFTVSAYRQMRGIGKIGKTLDDQYTEKIHGTEQM